MKSDGRAILLIVGMGIGIIIGHMISVISFDNPLAQSTKTVQAEKSENDNFSSTVRNNLLIAKKEMEIIKHKSDRLLEHMKEITINLEQLEKYLLNTNGLKAIIS